MKKVIFFMAVMVACAVVAQATEKQYVTINAQKYLRCQPVQNYYGKANAGITGPAGEWWLIQMSPAATWNSPYCAARGDELLFSKDGKPVRNKICNNPIVASSRIVVLQAKPKKSPVNIMRICVTGTGCDERSFTGMVAERALEASGGKEADVLELHYRSGKSMPFKAKRLRVSANGVAYPMQWVSSGGCVRIYGRKPFNEAQLETLLLPGEKLRDAQITEGGLEHFGAHLTTAVLLIEGATRSSVPVDSPQQQVINHQSEQVIDAGGRVFEVKLPVGNRLDN
jgi:hypothetical protein